MAGEFCRKRDERGRCCILPDGHYPPKCNFGKERAPARTSLSETASSGKETPTLKSMMPLIEEAVRAAHEAGDWVRLEDARVSETTLQMWKSAPSIADAQREAWEPEPQNAGRLEPCCYANAFGSACHHLQKEPPTPAAMLGEALVLQRRVADLLNAADPAGANAAMTPVALRAEALVTRIDDLRREAEARRATEDEAIRRAVATYVERRKAFNAKVEHLIDTAVAEAREKVVFFHCAACKPVEMTRAEADAAYSRKECNPEASKPCGLCGGRIGPDITGRPMCYGCGPKEMRP